MTILYPNQCYNEVCYKRTALYYYLPSSDSSRAFVSTEESMNTLGIG